jgi:hypothetical protein
LRLITLSKFWWCRSFQPPKRVISIVNRVERLLILYFFNLTKTYGLLWTLMI